MSTAPVTEKERTLPRYETAEPLAPDVDLSVLDESDQDDLPSGVDLYLVFLEPRAL